MNTPERMETMLRPEPVDAAAFDLVLRAAQYERGRDAGSAFVARARDVVLMRHARLGRYLESVAR